MLRKRWSRPSLTATRPHPSRNASPASMSALRVLIVGGVAGGGGRGQRAARLGEGSRQTSKGLQGRSGAAVMLSASVNLLDLRFKLYRRGRRQRVGIELPDLSSAAVRAPCRRSRLPCPLQVRSCMPIRQTSTPCICGWRHLMNVSMHNAASLSSGYRCCPMQPRAPLACAACQRLPK